MGKRENVSARFLQAAARRHSCDSGCVPSCVRCSTARNPGQGGMLPVQMGRTCCRESKAGRDLEEAPRGALCLLQLHSGGVIWVKGMVLLCWGWGRRARVWDSDGCGDVPPGSHGGSHDPVGLTQRAGSISWHCPGTSFRGHCWTLHL